jgi:hypothetical protein
MPRGHNPQSRIAFVSSAYVAVQQFLNGPHNMQFDAIIGDIGVTLRNGHIAAHQLCKLTQS